MADLLPNPPTPPGALWTRDWHVYEQYRVVHDRNMEALLSEGLVMSETLAFYESRQGDLLVEINLRGRVHTRSGAIITVNKWLAAETRFGRMCVMTREYDYHARAQCDAFDQNLFRYDNCDGGTATLHKHRFDASGNELLPKEPWELAKLPTLNHIIREADFYTAWLHDRLSS